MPASAAFMAAATAAVRLLPEYAALQTSVATLSAAGEEGRQAAWNAIYGDGQVGLSPAYRLRRAIRDVVKNTEVSQGVVLSQVDREAACQSLAASWVPDVPTPTRQAEATPSLSDEDVETFRIAMMAALSG